MTHHEDEHREASPDEQAQEAARDAIAPTDMERMSDEEGAARRQQAEDEQGSESA